MKNKFRGYYFKHQNGNRTVSFIPGISSDGAFVQVITDSFSKIYRFRNSEFGKDRITIGRNAFSRCGIGIELPGIRGTVKYTNPTPLSSDIMGVFRFFPMECRHEVVSMRHGLCGSLYVNGESIDFTDGVGYIEGDSGCSFPSKYLWLQANDFPDRSSFMLSVANIPFCGLHFRGIICVLLTGNREYRFATYNGVRANVTEDKIELCQGELTLEVAILSNGKGHSLASPNKGKMNGIIKECNSAAILLTLKRNGKVIWQNVSRHAGYERFPDNAVL